MASGKSSRKEMIVDCGADRPLRCNAHSVLGCKPQCNSSVPLVSQLLLEMDCWHTGWKWQSSSWEVQRSLLANLPCVFVFFWLMAFEKQLPCCGLSEVEEIPRWCRRKLVLNWPLLRKQGCWGSMPSLLWQSAPPWVIWVDFFKVHLVQSGSKPVCRGVKEISVYRLSEPYSCQWQLKSINGKD